jgi:hypothetical protein
MPMKLQDDFDVLKNLLAKFSVNLTEEFLVIVIDLRRRKIERNQNG